METERKIGATYEDVGGVREQIQRIREMIELPLRHPEVFDRLGIEPPRGVARVKKVKEHKKIVENNADERSP
jgi:ATP-dependent 26S proteasome regulatory subunit